MSLYKFFECRFKRVQLLEHDALHATGTKEEILKNRASPRVSAGDIYSDKRKRG
jgi:hypothetical protein